MPTGVPSNRRDFISRVMNSSHGDSTSHIDRLSDMTTDSAAVPGEASDSQSCIPTARETVRLGARAMACDFTVILNPGDSSRLVAASAALDLVGELEEQLSVYRESSEISQLNRKAASEPVSLRRNLFELLLRSRHLAIELDGAFDPTTGPLISHWRACRAEHRLPSTVELDRIRELIGIQHVILDEEHQTVYYDRQGVELNLGANGKGYAVDRAGELLTAHGISDWLIHGGQSSILARGGHADHGAWPIGLRNPLFPAELWATVLLENQAMGTSGSGVQHFRIDGKRYHHIINPQTGWPVQGQTSVTVFAPTAELADALSTAFFVMGIEKTSRYCEQHPEIGVILTPAPEQGKHPTPLIYNVPPEKLFLHPTRSSPT